MAVALVTVSCPIPSACAQAGATQPSASATQARPDPDPRPYLLDPKLFTPDDRWTYDASDKHDRPKARFEGAIAGQQGVVSIGDTRWLNSGAAVRYRVWKYDRVSEAHRAFLDTAPAHTPGKFARRVVREMKAGDEARDVTETVIDERGEPASFTRRIHVRFGVHLVGLTASADMKAFGPASKSGRRPWLCEAAFDKVLRAALRHWSAQGGPAFRTRQGAVILRDGTCVANPDDVGHIWRMAS